MEQKSVIPSSVSKWRRAHRCLNCESEFFYEMEGDTPAVKNPDTPAQIPDVNIKEKFKTLADLKKPEVMTPELHQKQAEAAVQRKENDLDMVPCPVCGFYQPEMFAERYKTLPRVGVIVAVIAGVFLLIGSGTGLDLSEKICMRYEVMLYAKLISCVLFGGSFLWFLWLILPYSNRNLRRNLDVSEKTGRAQVIRCRPVPTGEPAKKLSSAIIWHFCIPFLLAIIVYCLPYGYMMTLPSDAANRDCLPRYFGPGDFVRVWFPQEIESLKGYWKSTPSGYMILGDGVGGEKERNRILTRARRNDNWSNGVRYEKKSELRNSRHRIFVDMVLPSLSDQKEIVGSKVDFHFDVKVIYPYCLGMMGFVEEEGEISEDFTFHLSPAGTGVQIIRMEIIGYVGGLLLLIVALLSFCWTVPRFRTAGNTVMKDEESGGKMDN